MQAVNLQAHSASSAPAGQRGAVFHGQGGGDEEKKERLGIYFRRIDRGIQDLLASDRGPVILAAIDSLVSLYRKTNSTPELLDQWVSGNPDELAPQELLDRAAPIASAYFLQAQQQARDQYLTLQHTQRASNLLSAVLPAAIHGRVACLFVAVGMQIWGYHDLSTNEIRIVENPGAGGQDLLNLAAIHAYINGGTVYAVPAEEMPGGAPLAAVLRY